MRNLPKELLIIGIVCSFFFIPHWLTGNVFGTFDLSHITAPIEDIFARYQARGEVPLWAREFQAGFPLMANGFQSFFYLPHLFLRIWLPGIWLTNFSLLLHLWLAATGMWLLLRTHFPHSVAMVGSLIFATGGYFIGRVTLPHLFFPAAWLPLILWALWRLWHKSTISNALLLAVLYAAQIFSGHIQIAMYTGVMISIATIALIYSSPRWQKVLFLLCSAIAVWFLTAVHTLPTQELLPLSRRALPTVAEEAFDVSYPPRHLLTWLMPDYFGRGPTYHGAKNEPELMMYFGITGLLLGLTGLANKTMWRQPLGRTAIGLLVVGTLLAGGEYSPAFRWLHSLPTPLAQLANPGRAIIFIQVGWGVVVAFGANWLLTKKIFSTRSLSLGAGVVALELFIAGWPVNPVLPASAWTQDPQTLVHLPASSLAPRIFSHPHLLVAPGTDFSPDIGPKITEPLPLVQSVVAQRDGWHAVNIQLTWNALAATPGHIHLQIMDPAGSVLRESSVPGERLKADTPTHFSFSPLAESGGESFFIILSSDYPVGAAPRVIIATNRDGEDFNPTGLLQGIPGGDGQSVDLLFDLEYNIPPLILDRELFLPIYGESHGQEMLRGHLTLQLLRVFRYMYELGERGDFISSYLAEHRDMLDRLSAGTILSSYPEHRRLTGLSNLTLRAQLPLGQRNIHVYRNDQAYPLVSLPKRVVTARSADEARQMLVQNQVPPDTIVVENFSPPGDLGKDSSATVQLINRTSTQTQLQTESTSTQFLVIRNALFPGWQATIDGQPAQLYYVDSLFQGVSIPLGSHTIILQYHSKPFIIGSWLSGLSWLAAAGFLTQQALQRRQAVAHRGWK